MLFVIFLGILAIGITMLVLYCNDKLWSSGWEVVGVLLVTIGVLTVVGSCIAFGVMYLGVEGYVDQCEQRYESLTYQYENNIYDNDNDLGKKELLNQIQEWNEDLAWHRATQKDFWIGIFIPNVYDQFEFIKLEENYA